MPRDISGNYSLPSGNPVIAHETIESDWANSTMPDIAAALTDSLSRSGNGGMLVPFKFIDGSISAPGITFGNEPTSGIYRAGLNDVRVSIGTQDVFKFTLAGVTVPAGKTLTGSISGSISGGTINGTPIGGTTPSTGAFTNLSAQLLALGGAIAPQITFNPSSGSTKSAQVYQSGDTWAIATAGVANRLNVDLVSGAVDIGGGLAAHGVFQALNIALIGGASGSRGAIVEILRNSPYPNENAALYIMSGNGTAGEIGLYFSADKANGFAVINSLVPGTGPAPLSINPGAGQVRIGNTAALSSQTSSIASVRGNGNALEFGHNNQAGYGSTLGCQSSNGNPFLAFSAEAGTNINTYRTRGLKGSVVSSDLAGGFLFYTVPAANADNQAPTQLATLQTNGVFALPNASGSAAGTKFQSVSAQSKSVTNRDQSLWAVQTNDLAGELRMFVDMGMDATPANRYVGFGVHENGVVQRPLALNPDGAFVYISSSPKAPGMFMGPQFIDSGPVTSLSFRLNGNLHAMVTQGGGNPDRNLTLSGGIAATGEHGYVGVTGGGSLAFLHDSTGAPVRSLVLNYLAAAARWLTITPAIGSGNPAIGTSGGSINFTAPAIFSAGFSGFPTPSFESAELAIVMNSIINVAHGLGRVPKLFHAAFRCKVADMGFAVGDEILVYVGFSDGVNNRGFGTAVDAVNITLVCFNGQPTIFSKATKTQGDMTVASWKAILRAW